MAKQSSVNLDINNNADGYDISGGDTPRKLTVTGADITITGSGSNTYTFPASSATLAPTTSPAFDTSITGNYLTASEVLITDASKNIVSAPVATYPSLTELSYVKGVTSAIQTQIGTKAPTASPTFTGTVTTPAIKITTGAGLGKVLTSDADGDATWETPAASGGIKYAADAGSTDAYAITVSPAPTKYNIGDVYLFKANTANTGVATLNVNSLGAIPIKKKGATDLANNDILANNMVMVAYNVIDDGSLVDENTNASGEERLNNTTYGKSQSFTSDSSVILTSASFDVYKTGSPTGNVYAKIYAHSGTYGTSSVPTGSALAVSDAIDVSTLPSSSGTMTRFVFSGDDRITLSASTYYVVTIEYTNGTSSNYLNVRRYATSPGTHDGNQANANTSFTWTPVAYDVQFNVKAEGHRFEMLSQIAN